MSRAITTADELEALPVGSVVALVLDGERVNVALKTSATKWGLAGMPTPFATATLFRNAFTRDGFTLSVLDAP